MEFEKQSLIDFLNISLQTTPGQKTTGYSTQVNRLPKTYAGLDVKASVGMGFVTEIPWVTFTGYNQITSKGIYPVLLFYHKKNILIVAFGISVTNEPAVSWNLPKSKTIEQYFVEQHISQTGREKKYNKSFVHSVFPVYVVNNKVDESRFDIDAVFASLSDVCEKYKKQFERKTTTVTEEKMKSEVLQSPQDKLDIETEDVSKFKHLLEYFCAHLQYIVTQDKSVTGYDEYLKKYVDAKTFKKSGQGYRTGQKIQEQIKPWENYKPGKICIAVYGSSFQSYSTYLHWKGSGHNISANWNGNAISSLQLIEYKGNYKWEQQETKFTMDELGLYNNQEPNENVKIMYYSFVKMLSNDVEKTGILSNTQIPLNISSIIDSIKTTGLLYDDKLIQRYACSLMTKPFVILSGLAGSGKTQLALAFARAISENVDQQLCVVPVGADWTNREPLLGYPNALKQGEYMQPECGALQIMMRALRNPNKPYFLVLDEMNLSYVERYFADFLSALESHQEIPLWEKPDECDSEVPAKIALPKNLFIIGTINVDETTYMFSPKVLDRANVIEFKISEKEMDLFLKQDMNVDLQAADGLCANMGQDFVEKSTRMETESSELAQKTLISFFKVLKKVNAEFGYRSATEIYRFIANAKALAKDLTEDEILDAAIVQKLLPKLHGSRKKLEPALKALWGLCMQAEHTTEAITRENLEYAKFPESADKIQRMMQTALDNGFTSFAEA